MRKLFLFFSVTVAVFLCLSAAKPLFSQATHLKQFVTPQQDSGAPIGPPGADLNGDGKPDNITVQPADIVCDDHGDCQFGSPALLLIYLGKGDGTFQNPIITSLGYFDGSISLTVLDVNGDGKPDIAINFSYGMFPGSFLLFNDGKGNFLDSGKPGLPTILATGDFNGDGKVDVIYSNGILYGAGDGTFTQGLSFGNITAFAACFGDYNQDGKLDIAVAADPFAYSTGIFVFYGKGNGQYNLSKHVSNHPATELVTADINHDGYPDLLAADALFSNSHSVSVYTNLHNRSFSNPRIYAVDLANGYFFTGDFNGDGILDFSDGYHITYGRKGGSFDAPVVTLPPSGKPPHLNANFVTPSVGDFNKDGIDDVAVPYGTTVAVYSGSGKGYFNPGVRYDTGIISTLIATGDVDGDGILDIVTAGTITVSGHDQRATSVLLGNADGTFRSPIITPIPGLLTQYTLNEQTYLVDVNHDGKTDLIDSSGIALGNGDGTFGPTTPFPAPIQQVVGIGIGDLNRDGNVDLVVGQYGAFPTPAVIYTLIGDGKGGFTISHQEKLSYADPVLESLTVADMNEDGIPDLIYDYSARPASGDYSRVVVELGDGSGLFGQATGRTLAYHVASQLLVADYNRDGHMDVLDLDVTGTYISHSGDSVLLYGSSTGTLSAPQYFPLQTYSGAVINLNQDNAPDVVASTFNQLAIQRILNSGAR